MKMTAVQVIGMMLATGCKIRVSKIFKKGEGSALPQENILGFHDEEDKALFLARLNGARKEATGGE